LQIRYGWDPDVLGPTEATLYVAPDGDDAADGSLTRPLRSVQRGVDLLAKLPQGSLSIRGGIYREAVDLDALKAQPGAHYRLHRHGAERVQITAADVLTGWQACPSAEAAALGFAPEGVFVTRLARDQVKHGALQALNLHEDGIWCALATDRADMSNPERSGDPDSFHNARFVLDIQDHVIGIQDQRLVGRPASEMAQLRVLLYRRPNVVTVTTITAFDAVTGTITLADQTALVQMSGKKRVMRYALQNAGFALQPGQWIVREEGGDKPAEGDKTDGNKGTGQLAIYLRPRDPAHLDGRIEASLRPTCMDFGHAQGVELYGLELLRAAGQDLVDGICLRRTTALSDAEGQGGGDLAILQCRLGENFSGADRGYAALYLRGGKGVRIHHCSIGPARNSFGLFLAECRGADLRFLHIAGVWKSPARFFGLRQAVLAFSLFEDSAQDAHSNKFNFYEGCDTVLAYGIRCRNVGGYATYQEASRIHFAFCELNCDPGSNNRVIVSQNRPPKSGQGGADDSGDPVAGSLFCYWNNSLLADRRAAKPANSLVLGPNASSQYHAFHNNILHGGGFAGVYQGKADPAREQRSHNRYTGFSFWQVPRYHWSLGLQERRMAVGARPEGTGLDMRALIAQEIAPLFPGFTDWDSDIDGARIDWAAAPIGCKV
jgi:hypothetical protein